jgi:hypothetical protein
MAIKKTEMMLAYAIGGLLLVILVVRVIFTPFHQKLGALDRDATLAEARLKKGLGLIEKKDEIEQEYGKYASYFSLQGNSGEEAVAAFLREIEKLGRASGMTIVDIKPQKESAGDKFSQQYQISIKAEATMEGVVKFLHALQESSLLFGVDKMVLVPRGEEASTLSVNLTVVGVAFS